MDRCRKSFFQLLISLLFTIIIIVVSHNSEGFLGVQGLNLKMANICRKNVCFLLERYEEGTLKTH